jgi:hypothetical protein
MPDKEVKTIRDLIFYQYAKIIARAAFKCADGTLAKKANYGFIKKTFRDLRDNHKKWSDILREDMQFVESDKKCIFCGAPDNLTREHIVPKTLKVNERCGTCGHIQGVHNIIWSCKSCNSAKAQKGLYTYFKELHGADHFSDFIPPLLEKKYLKTIYLCYQCAGTLDKEIDGITVKDVDALIENNL